MGYKKPTKFFQKGVVTNPNGRPRIKGALKDIKTKIGDDLEKYINELMGLDVNALKEIAEDKKGEHTSFKSAIASIMYHAVKQGDPSRLEALLQRVIGKVKDISEQKHLFEKLPELKLHIIKGNKKETL